MQNILIAKIMYNLFLSEFELQNLITYTFKYSELIKFLPNKLFNDKS